MKSKSFFNIVFLILAFIIDSQLPLIFGDFLPRPFLFSSHVLIVLLLFLEKKPSGFSTYPVFFILGILADSYYYHTFGIAVFLYLFLVYLVKKHSGLLTMKFTSFLMLISLILVFEGGAYCLGMAYGLTNYPIDYEITYHLMPTLLVNTMIFWLVGLFFRNITD